MEENNEHISITNNHDGNLHLPLHDFFLVLKRNNFLITPKQISDVNRVIGQYANNIEDELELGDYLSPIFAKSQEEQLLFNQLFESYFKTSEKVNDEPEPPEFDKRLFIPIIILLGLIAWVLWYSLKPEPPKPKDCFNNATLIIQTSSNLDSIKVNDPIQLKALISGIKPDSIAWSSSYHGHFENLNNEKLETSVSTSGTKLFKCKAFYKNENNLCSISDSLELNFYDPTPLPRINIEIPSGAKSLKLKNNIHLYWYLIGGSLFLISLCLLTFFIKNLNRLRNFRRKTEDYKQNTYDDLLKSFAGSEGTTEVPFLRKNRLIFPELPLRTVATKMRKRINDDVSYMHIEKTISKVVNNAGFFDPVMASRTQQSEFLILIDKNQNNTLQVKLYEFLIELLKRYNVYMDVYYFDKTPMQCHNSNTSDNISLDKLNEKFPEHILLLFGNGYQLIHKDYPSINRDILKVINKWEYKSLVTPVPFLDWGNKEKKIIIPNLSVLPIDHYGIQMLMEKLFDEDVNVLLKLAKLSDECYVVNMIDFEDIDELLNYCNSTHWGNIKDGDDYSNILFQWIAALAVYPKINWELTLEIGKSILEKHHLGQELNFTTLLKLVRISWVTSGKFPDFMRLNLLKHLSPENEIIAREAILRALTEIPDEDLNSKHFAYEEKEAQRIINAFNLYAHDPIKYAHYSNTKSLFSKLNDDGLITDITVKSYMENQDLKWNTLIREQQGSEDLQNAPRNVSLDEFLTEPQTKPNLRIKYYEFSIGLSAFIFLTSLFLLIILMVLDANDNQHFPFTNKLAENRIVSIVYDDNISDALQTNNVILNIDNTLYRLINKTSTSQGLTQESSSVTVLIDNKEKLVSVNYNNSIILDTMMIINFDTYKINILPPLTQQDLDPDRDGIDDEFDLCPNEAGPVENNGCPWPDRDGDGVLDKDDNCPDEPGPAINNGCPRQQPNLDTDADGVPDSKDECPETAGPAINNGCPWPDSDGDGVLDKDDNCPDEPGPASNNGCPRQQQQLDNDKDGVPDDKDKCPETPGPSANKGCPWPDTDGDGILDKDDDCPTEAGSVANNGCPQSGFTQQEQNAINQYSKSISFDYDKTNLSVKSIPALKNINTILKKYPDNDIAISVHSDNTGNDRYNQQLTEKRANAIKDYFVNNGVKASRISSNGYGSSNPIDTNKTRAGRANNKRVEIKLVRKPLKKTKN